MKGVMFIFIIIGILIVSGCTLPESSPKQTQAAGVMDCGETPPNFATEMGNDDAAYFEFHPEVKESLECISENFRDCNPAKIKYLGDSIDNTFTVKEVSSGKCIVDYESGEKGIECEYTMNQINTIYEVSEEHGKPWAAAYGISFAMGVEILQFSPGKTIEMEMTIKDTGQKESIYCQFYSTGELVNNNETPIKEGIEEKMKGEEPKNNEEIHEWKSTDRVEIKGNGKSFFISSFNCGRDGYEEYVHLLFANYGPFNITDDDLYIFEVDGEKETLSTPYGVQVIEVNHTFSKSKAYDNKDSHNLKIGLVEDAVFETVVRCD